MSIEPLRTSLLALLAVAACGAPSAPVGPPTSAADLTGASMVTGEPRPGVDEGVEPIALTPLFGESVPRASFPRPTVDGRACLETVTLTGARVGDYAAILAACGAATGMREYVKPVTGTLQHVHDQRDEYAVWLLGGFCYRFFAASDPAIAALEIRVTPADGARAGEVRSSRFAVPMQSEAPWCVATSGDYRVEVELESVRASAGSYTLGVWARPRR